MVTLNVYGVESYTKSVTCNPVIVNLDLGTTISIASNDREKTSDGDAAAMVP